MRIENRFILKVLLPDGQEKHYLNCSLYKGKIALVETKEIGEPKIDREGEPYYEKYKDYYTPLVNISLLEENDLTVESAMQILRENPEGAIYDPRIFNSMFVLGENKGGKICIDETAEKQKLEEEKRAEQERKIREKEIPIPFSSGLFGLRIDIRLPKNLWQLIASLARYHNGGPDDEEWAEDMGHFDPHWSDISGWFYQSKAIDILIQHGYAVTYEGYPVTGSDDLERVREIIWQKKQEEKQREILRRKEKETILDLLRKIEKKGTLIEPEEAREIAKLPPLHFEALNIKGPTIYGSGMWLYDTPEAFYHVRNNGMDGDMWELNNFPTGGAGAICVKVNKPDPDVEEFLTKAKAFS